MPAVGRVVAYQGWRGSTVPPAIHSLQNTGNANRGQCCKVRGGGEGSRCGHGGPILNCEGTYSS